MKTRAKIAEHVRAYRQRQVAAGNKEVTLNLPRDAVAFLDEIKERQGLRNRSQALLQLIEQRGATAQQNDLKCESPPCRAGFCETRDGPSGYVWGHSTPPT